MSHARETTLMYLLSPEKLFDISPEAEIVLILVHSITLIPLDIFW